MALRQDVRCLKSIAWNMVFQFFQKNQICSSLDIFGSLTKEIKYKFYDRFDNQVLVILQTGALFGTPGRINIR